MFSEGNKKIISRFFQRAIHINGELMGPPIDHPSTFKSIKKNRPGGHSGRSYKGKPVFAFVYFAQKWPYIPINHPYFWCLSFILFRHNLFKRWNFRGVRRYRFFRVPEMASYQNLFCTVMFAYWHSVLKNGHGIWGRNYAN